MDDSGPSKTRSGPPPMRRVAWCAVILGVTFAGQTAYEALAAAPRLPLKAPLASIPYELGGWVGQDVPMDKDILDRSQATEFLNRTYQSKADPRRQVSLWINFSTTGLNMRHSPEICLPSSGWDKSEALTREVQVRRPDGSPQTISRLGYTRNETVQIIGFWYYIFGEGWMERSFRQLPLANRSSHGRTTRGSGLTVEIFCPHENDPEGKALTAFAEDLLKSLEPLLPEHQHLYHVP